MFTTDKAGLLTINKMSQIIKLTVVKHTLSHLLIWNIICDFLIAFLIIICKEYLDQVQYLILIVQHQVKMFEIWLDFVT